MSSIYDWSLSAAGNANADDIINWAEGQPPSSVNNSARSMMQRIKEFLSDLSGTIVATGTPSAIVLSTASPISAYINGFVMRFSAVATNTGKTTININSMGEKPVFKANYSGVVPLNGGEICASGIYEIVYSTALNAGAGGWFLPCPATEQSVPVGMIAPYGTEVVPTGWLECNGADVSRADYPALFSAIGTKWGDAKNSTMFKLPDYRGVFLRGWDRGRGIDKGRAFASFQDSQNLAHKHNVIVNWAGDHIHTYKAMYTGVIGLAAGSGTGVRWGNTDATTAAAGGHTHSAYMDEIGGSEARPKNMAVMYCIKA